MRAGNYGLAGLCPELEKKHTKEIPRRMPAKENDPAVPFIAREGHLVPSGLTFRDPLVIFTKSSVALSRTAFPFS